MQGNCRFIFMFPAIKIRGRLSGVTQVQLTVSDEEADEMAQRVHKTLLDRPARRTGGAADAFPGYRFRRRDFRGVPCYVAEARRAADAPLAAARSAEILADMLAAAAGRPVRLRPAAVAAAYRDRLMTVQQCAAMFGVSRTTIMKFLAAEGVALRRPGEDVDDQAVVTAYRDEGLSLHDCAERFGISQRRVAAALDRRGVSRRPVGRPPRSEHQGT